MKEDKKTILIVEDDPSLRSILKEKFSEEMQFRVEEAENGEDAVNMAMEIVPDLIVLDLIIPRKDGYQVIQEVREIEATSKIPIMLLTNLESPADVDKALSLGATNYLVKADYTLDEIVNKAKTLLEK